MLPNFTTSTNGPEFSGSQLVFAALASISLYVLFLFVQSVRHSGLFLHVEEGEVPTNASDENVAIEADDLHGEPPTKAETLQSLALLLVSLVAVVGLAKTSSHAIEEGVKSIGAPASAVGVVIALLVLMPETLAAWRTPVAVASRSASTSPTARRWQASASPSRRSPSPRSGSTARSSSVSARPRSGSSPSPPSSAR
jgi:Ca2+/H+ antiporter